MKISEIRTALWHFRKGGIRQLSRHLEYTAEIKQRESTKPEDIEAVAAKRREDLRGFDPLNFPLLEANENRVAPFANIRVASILDEFSELAWGNEFTLIPLDPRNWRGQLSDQIDLLLVESAWQGNRGQWRYQVVGANAPSVDLQEIVKFCRKSNIPTVFWNKEDPAHFEDFIESAKLFDVVATTDSACIDRYRQLLQHERVIALPFAAQPAIHNPIRNQLSAVVGRGDVCFAGTYFRDKFPNRRSQMELILDAGLAASKNLHSAMTIYSRNEHVDEKYSFPRPYSNWVVGPLAYSRMLSAYRGYKVFLNVNTVTDSPTMFSRRVLEILASGTCVVSTSALGIKEAFGSVEIPDVESTKQGEALIEFLVRSDFSRERIVHSAQRKIWEEHTYSHRAVSLLEELGIEWASDAVGTPTVAVILSSNRPERIDAAINRALAQIGVKVHVYVATHGFKRPDLAGDKVTVIPMAAEASLGECLNRLVKESTEPFIAKMDDDDYYGRNYVRDQINALRFSGATVVGKQAAYLYLEETDELVLRKRWREHMFTDLVLGATLVARRSAFERNPFKATSAGEDTDFLHRVLAEGGTIYSADRFNYIQHRGLGEHSWVVSTEVLKRNGWVVTKGLNTAHVDVVGD